MEPQTILEIPSNDQIGLALDVLTEPRDGSDWLPTANGLSPFADLGLQLHYSNNGTGDQAYDATSDLARFSPEPLNLLGESPAKIPGVLGLTATIASWLRTRPVLMPDAARSGAGRARAGRARLSGSVEPIQLTSRQAEILEMIARGLSSKQVGDVLGIAPRTVEVHTNAILKKFGVRWRREAIQAARSRAMIPAQQIPKFPASHPTLSANESTIHDMSMLGYKPTEIADKLGVVPQAVNNALYRARQKLYDVSNVKAKLSPREQEVLELMATNKTYAEMGKELGISKRTVEVHVLHLMKELGTHTREFTLREARRQGLIPSEVL